MSEVMTHRAFCVHGKVRAMMVSPMSDAPAGRDHLASAEYAKDFRRQKASWGYWANAIDCVTVEEARRSDMKCPACDEEHQRKKQRGRKQEGKQGGPFGAA